MQLSCTGARSGLNRMDGYFRDYGPEQREMVERWLGRMRSRFAGACDASDIGRALARERHLETLNQSLPISAQRFDRLQAEVADVQGDGAFLLVVDCGETGIRATRYVRRFETSDALQEAKRRVDAERCGPGCWRNHLLYQLAHPSEEDHDDLRAPVRAADADVTTRTATGDPFEAVTHA